MSRKSRSKLHPSDEFASDGIIDQLNIRYRVCHVFNPSKKTKSEGEQICRCGLTKEEHIDSDDANNPWNIHSNTLEKINPQYGPILKQAKFVRLAMDTPFTKVESILFDAWELSRPRFILSIIGGARYFRLSDRLETGFINGLVEIAQQSDAWLLTNGFDSGIVQLVGQAIRKVRHTTLKTIIAIGICKWGCIYDVENLTSSGKIKSQGNENQSKKSRNKGESELERHHSHYLMIDDGTVHDYDLKNYRTRFAIHMAKLEESDDIAIPAVTLVVEGGVDTLANVYYDLKKNVPVVLVAGSGRAADFLARWLTYTNNLELNNVYRSTVYSIKELEDFPDSDKFKKHSSYFTDGKSAGYHFDFSKTKLGTMFRPYENLLKDDVKNVFFSKPKNSEKEIEQLVQQIMYCLQPAVRSDITIFEISSDSNLSETILRSICQSRQKLTKRKMNDDDNNKKNSTYLSSLKTLTSQPSSRRKDIEEQHQIRIKEKEDRAERTRLLQLAMDWDCIDIAKEFIFQSSLDNILNKNKMFLDALKKNLPLFVYEFLKLKINLRDIFFRKREARKSSQYKILIEKLYTTDAVNHPQTHLKHFVDGEEDELKKIEQVEDLNDTLNLLIGDYMHKLYYNSLEEEFENRKDKGLMGQDRNLSADEKKQIESEYILRDLFLWAILMNYIQMAIVILSFMKYRLCSALIATKILKQYHSKASYGDLQRRYAANIKYFEDYACKCATRCYENNPSRACEIILQRNEFYGYITCLQVASSADDKPFLAQPCCADAVKQTWYDKLDCRGSNIMRLDLFFIGIISFGFLAPFAVPYRTVNATRPEKQERILRNNGINYSEPKHLEYRTPSSNLSQVKLYLKKFYKFHQSLPTRFTYHLITYIFFLLIFSYYLLFDFNPPTDRIPSIGWTEILTTILVSCMVIEELRYFVGQENISWGGKCSSYIGQHVKKMTLLGILLFYIGLILRFTATDQATNFNAARVVLAIDLEIWWLRSLWFIMVFPFIGPHLVSISKMIRDMLFFMCIIAIVMTGYGVASRSMAFYPDYNGFTTLENDPIDNRFDGRSVFHYIASPVYFMLYGEFGGELDKLDTNINAGWSIATHVLLAIHMMFVNILLINLLIAIFSKRFEEVSDDIQNIWHSQQYMLTREYYVRAPFFPPISILYDIWYLGRDIFYYCRRKFTDKPDDSGAHVFQIIPIKHQLVQDWAVFEEGTTYEYAHDEVKAYKPSSEKVLMNSGSGSNDKREPNKSKKIEEDHKAMDGLKSVEKQLTTINALVEEMKESLKPKTE